MFSPFGIAFGAPLDSLSVLSDLGQGGYIVEAPAPHPLFNRYVVRASPRLGIVWIKGVGAEIENDNFGTVTRGAADRVAEQLSQKYGRPKKTDFLMEGSIWSEVQDWMSALNNNERYYCYNWDAEEGARLPDGVESIFVGAVPVQGYAAQVVLEYASRTLADAEADLERQMADLL
ncbi:MULTISPECIES: hypothetical protein [unclassified Brevundimonas]|uniref:hypothetical protein n=1 Tax=unclassified Brevundimonas TaxID=2622653 RepID=UPI003F8E12AC